MAYIYFTCADRLSLYMCDHVTRLEKVENKPPRTNYVNKFSNVAGYRINVQKSALQYTFYSKLSERKTKTIPFIVESKEE